MRTLFYTFLPAGALHCNGMLILPFSKDVNSSSTKTLKIMKKTIILFLIAIAGYGVASAQLPKVVTSDKTGWHKIGETTVDFKKEKDEISIMGANRFSQIKFKVTDAPIDLLGAEAYYESGDKQDLQILTTSIKAPGESEIIHLNGGERTLKKIVLVYKTIPNYKDKEGHLEIWGLKTNPDKL
jgi:hypothetical protein